MISIASETLSADIDPLGAQLSVLRDASGRDLLWDGDPAVWNGRAPVLFPIVGALENGAYRLDGGTYALARHGFARRRLFEGAKTGPSAAIFRLRADDETLAVYPFRFELEIEFILEGSRLTMAARIGNRDDRPLPASFGFHPAFRWPLPFGEPRDRHAIWFDRDEPAPIRRLDARGLVERASYPTPILDRWLFLRDALFENDALILDQVRSRSVSYGAPTGPRLDIGFPDAPYLGIWTKPGAAFVCIEPWWGIADPTGFAADFRAKPGVFQVEAGETRRIAMSITLNS